MLRFFGILGAFSAAAFGGQSIQLSTQQVGNSSIPAQRVGNAWRVEFTLHNWNPNYNQTGFIFDTPAVGFRTSLYNFGGGNLAIQFWDNNSGQGVNNPCSVSLSSGTVAANSFVTIRFQSNPVDMADYCQAWDANGNLVLNTSFTFTSYSGTNSPGAQLLGTGMGQNLDIAYYRVYNSNVPTNSRPPVTADTTANCLVFWKFDNSNNTGSLRDSCTAGPYNATISGGSAVYVNTPFQSLIVPVLQTANPPAWAGSVSVRAGFPTQLNGNASYSQQDATPSVQCSWQSTAGPATLVWTNRNTCTPSIRGTTFGDYAVELIATDLSGNQATLQQDIGAVATDANNVVVNSNPAVDFIFGPMIRWGANPWGYADYWSMHATLLRAADYAAPVKSQGLTYPGWSTLGKPQWEFAGQGTVNYHWNCVGSPSFCNSNGLVLASALGSTDTTVNVNNGSLIDTSELPTRILVYDGSNTDEVRVCAASGNSLTLCYDPSSLPRHSFSSGAAVLQAKVSGSGTKFLTDSTTAVCPVGAPGLPGPSTYSAGTVSLTPGSTTMTGSGTAWMTSGNVVGGNYVRVSATHAGSQFYFMAQISSIGSDTSITLARPFPSDADNRSGLTYAVLPASRTIILHYPNLTDRVGDDLAMFGTTGCESEDAVYLNPIYPGPPTSFSSGYDNALDGQLMTGKQYSITDTTGWVNGSSTGGINFYGEDLAHWANYFTSGLNSAKQAAQVISNYWIHSPWANGQLIAYPVLYLGGGGLGAWVSYLTDPQTNVSISDLRSYAQVGVNMANGFASLGCNTYDDTRDSGWAFAFLIMASIYDPDTSSTSAPGGIPWRTYWQNALVTMQADDTMCETQTPGSGTSWANGFPWNGNTNGITFTNGSTAGTGTGLPSSMCSGIGTGTGSVINGSATFSVVTGSLVNSTADHSLIMTGTKGGAPFAESYLYTYSGTGAVTLAALWAGDSGTVTWMSSSASLGNIADAMVTFATSHDDLADLANNYACIYNSSTSITLDHPWQGPTGSNYKGFWNILAGYGQQPYMLGIKAIGMHLLGSQTEPALSSYVAPYTTFAESAVNWINTTGYDPVSQGLYYGRIFNFCEPPGVPSSPPFDGAVTPGCSFGSTVAAREGNAEVGTAASLFYEYNPTLTNRAWSDTVYGSLWGFCPWTILGVYCDSNSPATNVNATNLTDSYIHAGKWTGFFAGAGMPHRWPAARLGGALPPAPRILKLSFPLSSVTGAASAQVVMTDPSGKRTVVPCSTSPCSLSVDDRQGTSLYRIQYLNSTGGVISQTDVDSLQ